MALNVFLASTGIVFGFMLLWSKNFYLKSLFFILWLIFVPNSIYLVTDLRWLPEQFPKREFWVQVVLFLQYIVLVTLGIITFVFGLYPFEKFLIKSKFQSKNLILFVISFVIAFGVMLGRWQRLNSWDIFINPKAVIVGIGNMLHSENSLILVFFLGTLGNLVYFGYKKKFRGKKK